MGTPKTVWGIDVGQCALKALRLRSTPSGLEVEAFDIIEHPKILSEPDADRRQLIRDALEQFLARNNVAGCDIAVAVPGQTSFTRFVKLPPVEAKRIPDIVRFEAEQQIPFPIDDVIWRWQTFQDPDSPDVEVGIFAMKRTDVAETLSHFLDVELNVNLVQMAPLALYNFMTFDEQVAPEGTTLLADVGADKTDLVVADGPRIWTRTIQIGGNNFTEALVRAFKLSFSKAEKLKRTAATSKYARQIFQAMRPVFADLVQEIQRSVGYYTSGHREARFKRLVGLGNGFRLPGLQKFLEQNLNIPVVRIDSYNKLTPSPTVNAPTFTENVLSFAVSYGLALQGLEETRVTTNLLPSEVSRKRLWAQKRLWFAGAAAIVLACLTILVGRSYADRSMLKEGQTGMNFRDAQSYAGDLKRLQDKRRDLERKGTAEARQVKAYFTMYGYRHWWASVLSMISQSAAGAFPDQKLLTGPTEEYRTRNLERLKNKPRSSRKIVTVEKIEVEYFADTANAKLVALRTTGGSPMRPSSGTPGQDTSAVPIGGVRRGFKILLTGRTTLSQRNAMSRLNRMLMLGKEIAGKAELFSVCDYNVIHLDFVTQQSSGRTGSGGPGRYSGPSGAMHGFPGMSPGAAPRPGGNATEQIEIKLPDPMFPTEDMSTDTSFVIGWVITVDGDGVKVPADQRGRYR